ncbi:MAG: BglII/BstYI family type II restriction endonuclease [Limisphaerales bacterium]|jgi:hypothetical protein|nr:BglII/BstYI family type II restriction endonuclease [Verrucomicrobiota bacterium]
MKIIETYSHLNGLEFLLVHRKSLWKELKEVVENVNAMDCHTKVSKEKRSEGELLYSPVEFNKCFKEGFSAFGWKEGRVDYWVSGDARLIRRTLSMDLENQKKEIEAAGKKAIRSYNQTDFTKERVAVEIQFGKYAFVAYDLFVKHLAFYIGDKIDVGVEILPMKSLQSKMSSGIAYYEGEIYNVVRQGRGVPAVPLVILGVDV